MSYTPMGYNSQSLYDTQTQKKGLYNTATALNYLPIGRYNTQRGYNTLGNKESNYNFSKTPEVMSSSPVESFKPQSLNDIVEEEEKVELIFLPTPLRKNIMEERSVDRGYEAIQFYQPTRGMEQSKIGEKDKGKEMDQRGLQELIEKELKQFNGSNVQVQYV